MVLHMPKVGMLSIGTKSMMVAAGGPPAVTPVGVALSGAGVTPNEHVIMAPVTTCCPMIDSFRYAAAYNPWAGPRW
jgi:hypothetical protein